MMGSVCFYRGFVRILVASILWFLFLHIAQAESHDPYMKIRVRVSDRSAIVRLHELGVDIERTGKPGKDGIDCIARGKTLDRLRAEGIPFDIIVADLERFYAGRLTPGPVNALGFGYGSMGGYYTLSEIRQQLDSMRHVYPGVVGVRDSIGASLQGRPIWAVRMTANPDVPSQRPQVLYFAMQHAREPMGMMTLLYFMWYLAEQYGRDPEATYLLQNRDLWFIPIVNVDGYEANRRINPNGGGMRRKNMRNVFADTDYYGVDLNRNWGAEWGLDNLGSSSNSLYEDYRGMEAFSEPETRVVRDFFRNKAFRFVLEYHTYWNTIFYPPGYTLDTRENSDSLLFRAYVRELTRDNHYSNGNSLGAYPVNGWASDWFYENSPSLGQTFPFLTEIGGASEGFWAPTNRILPLASENLKANLFSAWAGGAYAKLQASAIIDSSGDGDLMPGERFTVQLRLRNFGQDPTTNMNVALSSGTMQLAGPSAAVGPLAAHADTTISIDGRVPITSPTGAPASIVVTVKPGGLVEQKDTVKCVIGRSQLLFADGAEEEPLKWTCIGWGRTPVAHTGQWSLTDSPSGQYLNNSTATMKLLAPVHISEAAAITQLRFWSRWDTEPGYDYGQVGVSSDGGKSWVNVSGGLASYYTMLGYTGWQPEWVEENIDVSSFAGKDVLLRFVLSADVAYRADGWYVDDITIRSYPIAGLSYAHDVSVIPYGVDTLRITARVENPLAHALSVNATLTDRLGGLIDSLSLKDDGLHGDSASADGLWGYQYVPKKDDTIHVTIRTDDLSAGTSRSLPDAAVFVFMRRPIISVSLATINLGLVPRSLSSRDTLFSIVNEGFAGDLIHVKIDTGNVSPSAALTVHPADFSLPRHTSRACTVTVSSGLLATNITFSAKIIVDADSAFGQTHYEIPLRFRVVTTDGFAAGPDLPTVYALEQNYPNPFNPTTTIRYGLPHKSHVHLAIFNTLGQQVAVLQDGEEVAGYHEVKFVGVNFASGLYFCRIRAGDFVETKKLVLTK